MSSSDAVAANSNTAYWWTHRTLEEEAAPPQATAAEASASCLQTIASTVKQHILAAESQLVVALNSAAASANNHDSKNSNHNSGEDDKRNAARAAVYAQIQFSSTLPPFLAQLRKTMERAWREHQSAEGEGAAAATTTTTTSSTSMLDDRVKMQLLAIQKQTYSVFLNAIQEGIGAALDELDESRAKMLATLPAVAMDGLLTDMCATPQSDSSDKWHCGLVSALRQQRQVGGAAEKNCIIAADRAQVVQYVRDYLHNDLALTAVDREYNFPMLSQLAKRVVTAEFDALLADANNNSAALNNNADAILQYLTRAAAAVEGLWLSTPTERASSTEVSPALAYAQRVAPLTTILDYNDAKKLVDQLRSWIPVCKTLVDSVAVVAAAAGTDGDGQDNVPQAAADDDGAADGSAAAAAARKSINEAYLRLRDRLGRLVSVFAQHADTSLAIPALTELLTEHFFVKKSNSDSGEREARAACQRYLQSRLHAVTGGRPHGSGSSSSGGFPEVCLSRVPTSLALLTGASGPSPADLSSPISEAIVLPLGYSLVHQPIATLRQVFQAVLTASQVISKHCSIDAVIVEEGGGSDRRAKALMEGPPASPHDVGTIFFPKLYTAFMAVEQALQLIISQLASKSNGAPSADNVRAQIQAYATAALEDAVLYECKSKDVAVQASMSEVLMFCAFLGSPSPMYPVDSFKLLRGAVQSFLGSWDAVTMSFIHRCVITEKRLGILAFFLPPLRALGVDHHAAPDHEHLAIALGYPTAADITFLSELPRGYYTTHGESLALHASADAIAFMDRLMLSSGEDAAISHAFTELVVLAGRQVVSRLDDVMTLQESLVQPAASNAAAAAGSGSGGTPVSASQLSLSTDVVTAFFTGVVRLVNSVEDASKGLRQTWLQSVIEQLFSAGDRPALPECYLLRGCRQGGMNDDNEEEEEKAKDTETPSSYTGRWADWLWAVEYEVLDSGHAVSCAKTLLQACNRAYMKQIATSTLLHRRSAIEKRADELSKQKDDVVAFMKECISLDIGELRRVAQLQAAAAAAAKEAEAKEAEKKAAEAKASAETAEGDTTTTTTTTTAVAAADSPAPTPAVTAAGAESKDVAAAAGGQQQQQQQQLSASAAHKYLETVRRAVLHRATLSPVDGAAAGVAFRLFTIHAAGLIPPAVAAENIRRMVAATASALHHASRTEAVALSVLMKYLSEEMVLPYKASYVLTDRSATALYAALPHAEREATNLANSTLNVVVSAIRHWLSRSTYLGDTIAYAVTLHCKRLMKLVKRYAEMYQQAVHGRRDGLSRAGITSPNFQLLLRVECPLWQGMTGPAADVYQLLTRNPPPSPSSAAAVTGGSGADGRQRGGGHSRGDHRTQRRRSGEREGRKRSRPDAKEGHTDRSHRDGSRDRGGGGGGGGDSRRRRERRGDDRKGEDRKNDDRKADNDRKDGNDRKGDDSRKGEGEHQRRRHRGGRKYRR